MLQLKAPGRLVVSPDPFGGRAVPLRVTARRLAAQVFDSQAALTAAWLEAPVVEITGRAEGAPATDEVP